MPEEHLILEGRGLLVGIVGHGLAVDTTTGGLAVGGFGGGGLGGGGLGGGGGGASVS